MNAISVTRASACGAVSDKQSRQTGSQFKSVQVQKYRDVRVCVLEKLLNV